ncbi:M23 family metallopeptidase [Sphingopyxis sp.]|uniref:M23 family metallopeptidase n=1 Tax=Sphingopyxis sp. TaxID=1908224 RepID=UPI003BA9335D
MLRNLKLLLPLLLVTTAAPVVAQDHSGFPVNVVIPKSPSPVIADGRTRLVYELHLTNFYSKAFDLAGIDVLDGDAALATYRGETLDALLMPIGAQADKQPMRTIEGGGTMVVFIDMTLPLNATAPARLRHRLIFTAKVGDGSTIERTVTGVDIQIQPDTPVIGPPLRGGSWVAANGLFNADHRRSFNAVDGREHLAQRFAIDWVKLGPDGRFFRDNASANANFYGYGADVIAVADGMVSAMVTDIPDNDGNNPQSGRSVTLDNITGNSLILDLGDGRYALYAHLQPGSFKVSIGDKVKTGQVLATLGNSGNSDAPHLHFQIMDANSPLGAEGTPYAIKSFTQLGTLANLDILTDGRPWLAEPTPSKTLHNEFPIDKAVVTFP